MAWIPVVEKLKEALTRRDLAEAETQIDILSKMDHHPRDMFQNLIINFVPALQHLAYSTPLGNDIDRMDKVVKCLTNSGYDINQQSEYDASPESPSRKFTALLEAISARNYDIARSFLQHGARTDIRDADGNSPLHWAVIVGRLDIIDLLLELGASVTSTEGERNGEEGMAHPLLHTAVDNASPELVAHLLRKGIFDVNEKAVYRDEDSGKVEIFSPLGRATRRQGTEIFWNLLEQPGIRVELEEVFLCVVRGDANMATALMPHLADICWTEVANGGVLERMPSLLWLLHKISSDLSLLDSNEPHVDFRPALATVMKQFVDRGYDLSQTWSATPETLPVVREPLLHYVLCIDLNGRTNILLQTLLELDQSHCVVPVTSVEGRNCLAYLLSTWNDFCQAREGTECWRPQPSGERVTCCVDAVKMLMSNDLNISQVVFREEFGFHCGYDSMIQMLYRNGVKVEEGYFSSMNVCTTWDPMIAWELEWDLDDLEDWKASFDLENAISLKDICRFRIRKMMTGKDELEMLKRLPGQMKEFVLRNEMD